MSVCIGTGLTFDDDGKLIVDEGELARATIRRTLPLNVPGAAADTTSHQKILYDENVEPPVNITSAGNELTIVQAGRYLLTMCQGDSLTENPGTDPATPVHIGIQIRVNGVQESASRMARFGLQTHILSTSRVMVLEVGDVVQGWFNARRIGAALSAHPLTPDNAFVLSVTQLPTQYVAPVA